MIYYMMSEYVKVSFWLAKTRRIFLFCPDFNILV